MGNIIKTAYNPDYVLEQAVGEFESMIIIGFDHDGEHDVRASLNVDGKLALWLVEVFKNKLLNGDYESE